MIILPGSHCCSAFAGIDNEKSALMPQVKFEKKFGQSPVFIASTLMEEGGMPHGVSEASLLKEAIHVISCGYEDKTEWGKEVRMCLHFVLCEKCLHKFASSDHVLLKSGWLDLWFSYRRYPDWVQNALSWMEVSVLHAKKSCI